MPRVGLLAPRTSTPLPSAIFATRGSLQVRIEGCLARIEFLERLFLEPAADDVRAAREATLGSHSVQADHNALHFEHPLRTSGQSERVLLCLR
ncbi:hypothetical protein D3C77_378210 [compost metagenome]